MNNSKESNVSRSAIKEFLLEKSTQTLIKVDLHNYVRRNTDPTEVIEIIRNLSGLKILIFVDLDNMLGIFKQLDFDPFQNLHCLLVNSKDRNLSSARRELNKPYFSIVKSLTLAKNAADIQLSILSSSLNLLIPNEVKFIICSRDGFIGELAENLAIINSNRKCFSCQPEALIDLIIDVF